MTVDILTPRLPETIADPVIEQVDALWEQALQMTGHEIKHRSYIDAYGEPLIPLVATWTHAADLTLDQGKVIPMPTIDIRFADDDNDPDINARLHVFRTGRYTRLCLVARIIGHLHLDLVRRMNPTRPLLALEDDEITIQAFEALTGAGLEFPLNPEILKKAAIEQLSFEEECLRSDGESAHQRFEREIAQRERRRRLAAPAQ